MADRPSGPRCGNDPNARLTPGDRQAVADFKAYLADRAALRKLIATAVDEGFRLTAELEDLELGASITDSVLTALLALPAPADRASVYREVADRLAADAEQGAKEGFTRIYRRSAANQVRAWADELAAAEPADETRDATTPQPTVKASSARYAEELRRTPGEASADGHTGWECTAGASLIVRAETPGPGRLGTHHGVIYSCAEHQAAAEERIAAGGYQPQTDPAPAGHRWDPWPCGHVTAYNSQALTALQRPAERADRAAVLEEAAGIAEDVALKRHRQHEIEREQGALDVMTALRQAAGEARFVAEHQREVVHGCPPDGSGLTPCCGKTPFELPRGDRISSEAPATCTGPGEGA